ncbi:MAG: hypothetical protein IJW42_00240 [Alistipes sp.]|nr:hypothetical protein [Alistipes sp.]
MKALKIVAGFILLCSTAIAGTKNEVGKPYKGWKQGEFDIHHIHTGMGEANFLIMPDGTSMLIDAGDLGPNKPEWKRPKVYPPIAECEHHPGKYIARYVLRVNPHHERVDYFLSSHFHDDHLCKVREGLQKSEGRNPDYHLTGVTEVGEYLRFGKFYDRGYPNYNYPLAINSDFVNCYRRFVQYHSREYGATQEEFKVGQLNQIALTHRPKAYAKLFSIRNIAANGEVWSGKGTETTRYYDLNPKNITGKQNENTKSIVLRFDYGDFSYYTGGDIVRTLLDESGSPVNIEVKVGEACGEVDICKTNHHGYRDSMKEEFLNAVNADHYISCAWDIWHTQPAVMERILSHTKGMFFHQFVWSEFLENYHNAEWMKRLYKDGGHIVVKAFDKGRKYMIYILDSSNEEMIVKAIFGPFSAIE